MTGYKQNHPLTVTGNYDSYDLGERKMAIRLGEKPLTNAEKQKRFRDRRRDAGLVRRDTWTDRAGFLAKPSDNGGWTTMSLKEFKQHLDRLLSGFEGWEREVVYAEILEYAKKAIPKFENIFAAQREIEQAELNG